MGELLQVENLKVSFPAAVGVPAREVLAGINLKVGPGEAVALVGPSGCGKSMLTRALLGLLPAGASWSGRVLWRGQDLTEPEGDLWRRVRGSGMTLVLQEPQSSLNPVLTVGDQIAETIRFHQGVSGPAASRRAVELLDEVLVPEPKNKAACFPHQLSGGMRQRVLLAAAMACDPDLLLADEPTTALDVTVQREILALINRLRRDRNMGLLFITHDEDLVPLVATRQVEMEAGRIISDTDGDGWAARRAGSGPETARRSVVEAGPRDPGMDPVLKARGLKVGYGVSSSVGGRLAVGGVDIDLVAGQAVGLAGESGCGKSSLARALSRHLEPAGGKLDLAGRDFLAMKGEPLRRARRRVQMMFQDPAGSLNPRQKIGSLLSEAAGPGSNHRVSDLLGEVGLAAGLADRHAHELSGGQRQRVALARCLAAGPSVLIADEPTSSLDPAARDRILALLVRTMERRGLALMVISHDLEVLHAICGRVAVMAGGFVVESYPAGKRALVRHPVTLAMAASGPAALNRDPRLWDAAGSILRAADRTRASGCPHAGRCPLQKTHCFNELPQLKETAAGHWLRCPEAVQGDASLFIDT